VVLAGLALASPAQANQVPVTQSDFYRMPSTKSSLVVRAPGVLANDSDPDGDPIIAELLSPTNYGDLELRRNGGFTFTPPSGFSGFTSFDYLARDTPFTASQCCGHAYIIVTRPPEATDDSYAAISGVQRIVDAPGVLANDGADRARLADPPDNGTASIGEDGRLRYRSDPGFVGTDTFTYEAVVQGEQPDTATVTMRVKASNAAPVAVTETYVAYEDTPVLEDPPGVLANDTDADGDPLTAVLVSDPIGESFELRPDGSFEYYPPANYDSPVTFRYRVDDGLVLSPPVTVEIDIRAVNDSPFAEEDYYELEGSDTLEVSAPGVLANDYDEVEFDTLIATRLSGPRKGTLTLDSTGGFTYQRDPGATGRDRFRYRVSDSGGAVGNIANVWIYP
jgi:hypothetical protein